MLLYIQESARLMITTTDFARHLSRFLSEYLPHQRNVSPNTIASYWDAFVQYIDYMKSEKDMPVECLSLKHLTRESVMSFMLRLLDVRKAYPATRNYRLAAIHSFCSYLQYAVIEMMEEWQKTLSIKAMNTVSRQLNYLSVEAAKLLLEQPDTSTRNGRHHLAIVPLVREQVAILRSYMEEYGLNDSNKASCPLFFNNRHEHLTREGISYILSTYVDMQEDYLLN